MCTGKSMSELTHKPGLPLTDKEYREHIELFKRMEDGSFDDKVRSNNEKK